MSWQKSVAQPVAKSILAARLMVAKPNVECIGNLPQLHEDVSVNLFWNDPGLIQLATQELPDDGEETAHLSSYYVFVPKGGL